MAISESIPTGFCQCGCGQATAISNETRASIGIVKGQPYRYCHGHHRREPLEIRFWRKVRKSKDGCWLWTGSVSAAGYGNIGVGKSTALAHRVSWMLANGDAPDGMCVCHRCDVPLCVRPSHLFLGSNLDNVRDRERKGRNIVQRGANSHFAKLTDQQVETIRRHTGRQVDIANEFGISQSAVSHIKVGRTWKRRKEAA